MKHQKQYRHMAEYPNHSPGHLEGDLPVSIEMNRVVRDLFVEINNENYLSAVFMSILQVGNPSAHTSDWFQRLVVRKFLP